MDRILGPRFVGTTGRQQADGTNLTHLVRDTTTWTASCGKRVVEAIEYPADRAPEVVTCRTCQRAIA